jgi:hypothetical protein
VVFHQNKISRPPQELEAEIEAVPKREVIELETQEAQSQ